MTQPRAALVSLDVTPWYHLVNRCVRCAFLCGTDPASGCCYEHRRGWIADRLAGVFAIDVAAYAVMSNHYHLVVRQYLESGWEGLSPGAGQRRGRRDRVLLGGRFKSQALLDEAAILSAMAYVDLNPIRAGIAVSTVDAGVISP